MAAMAVLLALGLADPGRAAGTWTLMAYLRTQGGLAEAAQGYLAQLCANGSDRLRVAVQLEEAHSPGRARRLLLPLGTDNEGNSVVADMGSAAALSDFLGWAQEEAPGDRSVLLILAHGMPPAPAGAPTALEPGTLAPSAIAAALAQALSGGLDVVFLDCCYTGSVEVADELAGRARYLVAPPGLLYSPGLPWGAIAAQLRARPEMSARELARVAVQESRSFWATHPEVPAGLVAIELDRVPELSQAVSDLAQAALPVLAELTPQITLARGQAATWGPHSEMVNVEAWAAALAAITPLPEVAEHAERVSAAARAAAVAGWRQEAAAPGSEPGVGIFFPMALQGWSARYGTERPRGFRASWESFVKAYLQRVSGLTQAATVARNVNEGGCQGI